MLKIIQNALHAAVRSLEGRAETPTLSIVDSQSVKRAEKGGDKIDSPGYDAGKKIKGKKHLTAVGDTLGLLINIVLTPGEVQDRHVIAPLLEIARKRFASLNNAIADGSYQGKPTTGEVQQQAGIPLEIVKRSNVANRPLVPFPLPLMANELTAKRSCAPFRAEP